jgi:PAS domain S-box-containing protein
LLLLGGLVTLPPLALAISLGVRSIHSALTVPEVEVLIGAAVLFLGGIAWIDARVVSRVGHERERTAARLLALLESADQGICGIDAEGRCTVVNPAAATALAYRAEDLIGRSIHEVVHGSLPEGSRHSADDCPLHWTATRGDASWGCEEEFCRRDGVRFLAEYSCSPILRDGRLEGAVLSFRDFTQRRHSEEERREMHTTLDNAVEGISLFDAQGRLTRANRTFARGLGYTEAEIVGRDQLEFIHPDDRDHMKAVYLDMKNCARAWSEVRGLRRDGSVVHLEMVMLATHDVKGRFIGHRAFARDVSERKEAEAALRESEDKFRSIVETTREWIWEIDQAGRFTYSNPAVATILGCSSSALLGRHRASLLHPDDRPQLATLLETCVATRAGWTNTVMRWLHDDGSYRHLQSSAVPVINALGELIGFRGADCDVTERRRNEWRLAEAHQLAQLGSWEWDIDEDRLVWSAELFQLFDVTREEFDGTFSSFFACVHPEDRVSIQQIASSAIQQGKPFALDYRIVRKDGSCRVIHATGERAPAQRAERSRIVGTAQDITERVADERERGRQHQLELQEQFMSHVSHELRSPVTAIYQFVTILLDRLAGDLTPEQEEYLGIMNRNVHQLRNMISDLLEVTRAQTGKLGVDPRRTGVAGLVQESLESVSGSAADKHITLTSDIPAEIPDILADPRRLQQCLINLLVNAVKFTPEGGSVAIRVRSDPDRPDFVRFSVADTGCGIDPADHQRIFEHLYQSDPQPDTSRKGLGLGLYISRQLISLQGGTIWVESEPGRGSTFHFTLPTLAVASLIATVLTVENLAKGSVALVSAYLYPSASRPLTDQDEPALLAAWAALQRSYLPDCDVLLPRLGQTDSGETFVIVACADQSGAEVICQRARSHLAASAAIRAAGLDFSVQYDLVKVPALSGRGRDPSIVEMVSTMVRTKINEMPLRRVA